MKKVANVLTLAKTLGATTVKVHFLPTTVRKMPRDTVLNVDYGTPAAHHSYTFGCADDAHAFCKILADDFGIAPYKGSLQPSYSLLSDSNVVHIVNQPVLLDKVTQKKVNKAVSNIASSDRARAIERWHPHKTVPLGIKWVLPGAGFTPAPMNLHGEVPVGVYDTINGILTPKLMKLHKMPPSGGNHD